jgi:hypothetical protein
MKKIGITFLLAGLSLLTQAQELAKPIHKGFDKKNSVQFELFGHGLFYSVNYERVLINRHKFKTTAQAGISFYPVDIRMLWIPLSVNQLISFNQHHLELGIGQVLTLDSDEWEPFGSFRIGYRYQKPEGRFLFRAGFTPFIEYAAALEYKDRRQMELYPSGGLAIGYSF